ncbi:hypothetical protein A2164_00190 [Candidatus Curtissbacteria bacterium RBG_13_35_7]|uniref:Methyltransferase type 11 domain-containing protein n=1 Tax=Candidatus Curtissbacteria bacterium RBG_13_35_7 TaxID=1797705 RepID=A0A1F5G491_9BACT|nr:MAG: hypothetical protein A2164_00190 [Candidatus Curtissbacteria bacterium RBG_13_35_7]
MKIDLDYYLLTSYYRKSLDKWLEKNIGVFEGNVLDVGGAKKDGNFTPPKCNKWVVVDIDKKLKPDIVASVTKLPFKNNNFDVIKATELFEHVDDYERGFSECVRVLKTNGKFVVSSPFLIPLHPDPHDFQRLTREKWESLAKKNKLKIVLIIEQGYIFTLISEILRNFTINLPLFWLRYPLYLLFPFLDLLTCLDSTAFVQNSRILRRYIRGYFIVFKK